MPNDYIQFNIKKSCHLLFSFPFCIQMIHIINFTFSNKLSGSNRFHQNNNLKTMPVQWIFIMYIILLVFPFMNFTEVLLSVCSSWIHISYRLYLFIYCQSMLFTHSFHKPPVSPLAVYSVYLFTLDIHVRHYFMYHQKLLVHK